MAASIPGRNQALVPSVPRMQLRVLPLTPERWDDLLELFGRSGASIARGCFCMFYRHSGKQEPAAGMTSSESNKRALKALVDSGAIPGLLGYENGRPVGWISLGPRDGYAKLARSPVMKPVDAKPVWSIVCFFVDAKARHRGVAEALLKGAMAWARERGATLLEAYPCDKPARSVDDFIWFGAKPMFDRAGFVEVARRKPTRPVLRKALRGSGGRSSRAAKSAAPED